MKLKIIKENFDKAMKEAEVQEDRRGTLAYPSQEVEAGELPKLNVEDVKKELARIRNGLEKLGFTVRVLHDFEIAAGLVSSLEQDTPRPMGAGVASGFGVRQNLAKVDPDTQMSPQGVIRIGYYPG